MNNYELMVIFTPVLSDDEFKAEQKKVCWPCKRKRRLCCSRKSMGTKITGVFHQEKNHWSLLGDGIYCAIRLQRKTESAASPR